MQKVPTNANISINKYVGMFGGTIYDMMRLIVYLSIYSVVTSVGYPKADP